MQYMSGRELDERIHKFLNKKFDKFPSLRFLQSESDAREFRIKEQRQQQAL